MQAPDPIETILARLIPPALSDRCQTDIEEMVSDLAGPPPESVVAISSGKWIARSLIAGGIAAAIGAMCAVFPIIQRSSDQPVVKNADSATAAGIVLISESDRLESVTDEGWRADSEGAPMHSVRFKSMQKNKVRDEQSGMVMQICEPREEILMVPVSPLADASGLKKPLHGEMVEAATVPAGSNGPIRVVNIAKKEASFVFPAEGEAAVSRADGLYQVKICGSQGEVVFEGSLAQDDILEQLPEIWRNKVQVLCRTLDQALDGGMMPTRQPQPRIAPITPDKP